MLRTLALLLALVTLLAATPRAPRPATAPAEVLRLRVRAAEMFALRDRARAGGIALEPLYENLVALADSLERAGLDSLAADALRKAGGVIARTSRAAASDDVWRRSIAIARRARFTSCELDARSLLAQSATRRDPELGLTLCRETAAAAARAHDHDARSDALVGASNAAASLGRMREAREAAIEALRAARRGHDFATLANAHLQVAQCWHAEQQEHRALLHADSAVSIARRSPLFRQSLGRALVSRANVLRALDRPQEAMTALEEALAIDRARGDLRHSLRTRNSLVTLQLSHGSERLALAHAETLVTDAARARDVAMEHRGLATKALALAELSRWSDVDTLLARALPRFEQSRDDFDDAESRAGVFLRGGEMYATWARALLGLGRTRDAWRVTERGRAAVFRRQLGNEDRDGIAALAALQARLRTENAALLQWNDPQRNPQIVFVIDADSVRALSLGKLSVAADAKLARQLLARSAPRAQVAAPLERIARALLDAPLRRVRPGTKRLWLIPPGEVTGLPMEVLPVAGGGTLGERWAISYPPSATAATLLAARVPAERGLALFADPDARAAAGASASPGLRRLAGTPLPGAREEARRIAPFGTPVWSGRDATREKLASCDDRAVVHLATHAWVDPARPDESGLLLAGPRGLVTAAQVESLTFRADLVTLSGCHTAQGEAVMGEGVFGLPRAFLLAGARSVVSTAWEVDDRAASRFMTRFYEELRRGVARDEALQRARATLRAEKWPARDVEAFVLIGLGGEPVRALGERGWFGR